MFDTAVRRPTLEELARIEDEARKVRAMQLTRFFGAVRRRVTGLSLRGAGPARA
jgi:hypothetical protein